MSPYSIALFDWDDHFVETMRVWAESSDAEILHYSSPQGFEQSLRERGERKPDMILVDVDTFRLDEASGLGKMLGETVAEVPHVFLTQSTELIRFHLSPHIAQFVCMPKRNFILNFKGLVGTWRACQWSGEHRTLVPAAADPALTGWGSAAPQALQEMVEVQRALRMSEMTRSASAEIENMNQVLMSAMEHITALSTPATTQVHHVLGDLEWVATRMAHFAQTIGHLHHSPPQGIQRVDVRHMMAHTIDLLTRTGRSRHVGIEAKLGTQPIWVHMDPRHLEHTLVQLTCSAIDAVIESHATFRRINVRLVSDRTQEHALVLLEDFAGAWHHDKLHKALGDPDPSLHTRSLCLAKELVELHGGLVHLETSLRGTLIRIELPLDGAIEVTSPSCYKPLETAEESQESTEVVLDPAALAQADGAGGEGRGFESMDTLDIPISHSEVMEILRGDGPKPRPKTPSPWKPQGKR